MWLEKYLGSVPIFFLPCDEIMSNQDNFFLSCLSHATVISKLYKYCDKSQYLHKLVYLQ